MELDSGFTALGLWHINKWRAWLEIISLLDAQWENGMILTLCLDKIIQIIIQAQIFE